MCSPAAYVRPSCVPGVDGADMTAIPRPGSPPLRVVAPPDPFRTRGGEVPSLDGPVWPFARLPDAVYHVVVRGWSLGPVLHAERPPRAAAAEAEQDWRF